MNKEVIEQRLQDLQELKQAYHENGKDTSKLVAEIQQLRMELSGIPPI